MADGGHFGRDRSRKPRFAYSGEEAGFGNLAINEYAEIIRENDGYVPDAGYSRVHKRPRRRIEYQHGEVRQSLRSKELALSAVSTETADYAFVPFYNPNIGYDTETLATMSALLLPMAVDMVDAVEPLCLAVYEPQVLDLVHASHPGSNLSYVMRNFRSSARGGAALRSNDPGVDLMADEPRPRRAGAVDSASYSAIGDLDPKAQAILRDRVDLVFAGPEAMRRCKAKLDGLRAAGVTVEETVHWVEPHREMARRVRDTLDRGRQTSTAFDPVTGEARFTSIMSAEAQTRPLYAVVLPRSVARNAEFKVIDDLFDEDAKDSKTRFFVVDRNPDVTLIEGVYKIKFLRVQHWLDRLDATAGLNAVGSFLRDFGSFAVFAAVALSLFFTFGASFPEQFGSLVSPLAGVPSAMLGSAALAMVGAAAAVFIATAIFVRPKHNVRVLTRFHRGGDNASLGRLEEYLRYFGVRHSTVRLYDDAEKDSPAATVLDVEFDKDHFRWNPVNGCVVRGFLARAFERDQHGMAKFLAAIPYKDGAAQLPPMPRRRWWAEGFARRIQSSWEALVSVPEFLLTTGIGRVLLIGGVGLWIWQGDTIAAWVMGAFRAIRALLGF